VGQAAAFCGAFDLVVEPTPPYIPFLHCCASLEPVVRLKMNRGGARWCEDASIALAPDCRWCRQRAGSRGVSWCWNTITIKVRRGSGAVGG